jgi:hypothetical protein
MTNVKKVTITKVYRNTEKADGTPYVYKNDSTYHKAGDPFTRMGIETEQTGSEVHYANIDPKSQKYLAIEPGQTILVNLTTSVGKDGSGEFKNFNLPTKDQLAEYATSL